MNAQLLDELKKLLKGDVVTDEQTLADYNHDASIFAVTPQVVVFPKDQHDVEAVVQFVSKQKKDHPELSLTARSAGTDMSGGSINQSIILAFGKYFTHTPVVTGTVATTEPGVFYRDFEKETLKHNLIFPSYPSSREICAMGGIVGNNAGGEKSMQYGKTEKYVQRVKAVLSDGKTYVLEPLSESALKKKMAQKDFEGEMYKKMYALIMDNYEEISKAKPAVSKNSAGYFLWNVYDKEKKIFDLTKLFVGSQGTLGVILEADISLVPVHTHREMEVIYLHNMSHLGQIIDAVLPLQPESFESYDDNTLKLALKYFPGFIHQLGVKGLLKTGWAFLPLFFQMGVNTLPKLVLQVDFTGNDPLELQQKIATLREKLKKLHPQTHIAIDDQEKKYWLIRRESFNLLRHKIHDKYAAPFIDDFVINPHDIAEVIPQVTAILKKYPEFIFTVAGHVGDGNFHIIPLVDLRNPASRAHIPEVSKQVYDIVITYKGSTTGEHNDGYIRTPYLEAMYGKKIVSLFEKTKNIFDPDNIFNPGKKVYGSLDFSMKHIRQNW